jgi:hypothetical protein
MYGMCLTGKYLYICIVHTVALNVMDSTNIKISCKCLKFRKENVHNMGSHTVALNMSFPGIEMSA